MLNTHVYIGDQEETNDKNEKTQWIDNSNQCL